jgi:mannose-6-phosphate isomerase-like protein (cupin superfamily)
LTLFAGASVPIDSVAQRAAEFPVAFDVPLTAHRFFAALAKFEMQQRPMTPSRRLGAASRIVLLEPSLNIGCPADVGQTLAAAPAAQHIDETWRFLSGRHWVWCNFCVADDCKHPTQRLKAALNPAEFACWIYQVLLQSADPGAWECRIDTRHGLMKLVP